MISLSIFSVHHFLLSPAALCFYPVLVAAHGVARQTLLNSYEYDYEPKRYISLVKTADTCVPSVLLSAASAISYPPLPASLQSLSAPILFFTRKNPDAPYSVTATDNRAKLKASETKVGPMTVGDVVSRFQQLLRSEECSRAVISEVKVVGPSTVALHFTDMTGAMLAAYVLGLPSAASVFDGLFTIDRAFDGGVYADLLAASVEESCLKQGGQDDGVQRGAFADHADDDFFGARGGPRRPLFLAMPAAPKTDAASSGSSAPRSAPPGLAMDPSDVAALRDEWESILGDDSRDAGASAGTGDASSSNAKRPSDDETQPGQPISEDAEGSTEATSKEASPPATGEESTPAPAAAPAVYRRLQLAPRTLPPPLPPMPPRPERPTADVPGDAGTLSSKQRTQRPQKHVRSKPTATAGAVKPANAFQMLCADDDDDDDDEGENDDNDGTGEDKGRGDKVGKDDREDGSHCGAFVDGDEAEPAPAGDAETGEDWQLAKALQASESEADRLLQEQFSSAPSSALSGWACEVCTLVNEEHDAECKVCGTPSQKDSSWQTA